MMMHFDFDSPTKILFGSGMLNELSNQPLPGRHALILISNGCSTRRFGYLNRALEQLAAQKIATTVFDKIMENPTREVVMEGAAFAKSNHCDFIVALGGGAVLDAAVAIAAMATNKGDLWDYVMEGTGRGKVLAHEGLPMVTICTTSGTGSEINCWGVISNRATNEKIGFGDPRLVPVLAIVDPQLMVSVPPKYTAFQGFDALFHNTESLISNKANIMTETLALSAIKHISTYLPRAVQQGSDLEAREHVAFGSTVAGMTMQLSGCVAKHSMEHAMSAYHPNLPHGAGLILISQAFYQYLIEQHICDDQFVKMAKAMDAPQAREPKDFTNALAALQEACGVADLKMSDYGIGKDEAFALAKGARAMQGSLFLNNPYNMTDEECAAIFEQSCLA